jgi:hypothetical protein
MQDENAGQRMQRECRTSMIGNSQGEAEIPHDLAEGVLPTGKIFAWRTVLDPSTRPTHKQRGQTSICGNNAEKALATKIE